MLCGLIAREPDLTSIHIRVCPHLPPQARKGRERSTSCSGMVEGEGSKDYRERGVARPSRPCPGIDTENLSSLIAVNLAIMIVV